MTTTSLALLCSALAASLVAGIVRAEPPAPESPADPPPVVVAGAAAATETTEEIPASVAVAAAETSDVEDHGLRVRLLGIAAFAHGDSAQFQQRHRIADQLSGGIEELHYETRLGEDTDLELDGRALFGTRDYLLGLSIRNEDKGFLELGYRQFRTWYDGRGGYYPPADASFVPFDPELGVDRGEGWARGGLVLPQGFLLTIGYRYLLRDGTKSSTIWGDTSALGLEPPNNRRNIVPSFQQLDEDRHLVDVALTRETETSEAGAGFRYEHMNLDDRRHAVRTPGEPTERVFTERDGSRADVFASRAYGLRRFVEGKVTVSAAYAFNDIDLDLAGSRIYGSSFNPSFNPAFPNRQQRDEGYFDLQGATNLREHVGNLAVSARPFEDFQILSALRVRSESRDAHASFEESSVGAPPDLLTTVEELETRSDTDDLSWAEDLELRYRGIEHVVLYVRGQWEQNDGDIHEAEIAPELATVDIERSTAIDRQRQKYAAGANWYPIRWLGLSTEYSWRLSDYDYGHRIDSTPNDPLSGDRYPAFIVNQEFSTHALSLRGTLRLPADVTVVARYDWLQTTVDSRMDFLEEIQSAQVRSHLVGVTVSWNPAPWWWTQTGANWVDSTTDTSANDYATPVAPYFPSFDNNYLTLHALTGAALDQHTDVELRYHWMHAPNYQDLSAYTVAYGSRFNEHGVRAAIGRRFGDHTRVAVSYGWFRNDEYFAGGTWDYGAHLLTTSVEFTY